MKKPNQIELLKAKNAALKKRVNEQSEKIEDYEFLLPWNVKSEMIQMENYIEVIKREDGCFQMEKLWRGLR